MSRASGMRAPSQKARVKKVLVCCFPVRCCTANLKCRRHTHKKGFDGKGVVFAGEMQPLLVSCLWHACSLAEGTQHDTNVPGFSFSAVFWYFCRFCSAAADTTHTRGNLMERGSCLLEKCSPYLSRACGMRAVFGRRTQTDKNVLVCCFSSAVCTASRQHADSTATRGGFEGKEVFFLLETYAARTCHVPLPHGTAHRTGTCAFCGTCRAQRRPWDTCERVWCVVCSLGCGLCPMSSVHTLLYSPPPKF